MVQEHTQVRVIDAGSLHAVRPDDVAFVEECSMQELAERVTRIEQWIDSHKHVSREPRRSGPLYYPDPVEFKRVVERAVEGCVDEWESPTISNVLKHIHAGGGLKLQPNTFAQRLRDHKMLKPGQTPAVFIRALASQIRSNRGHLLLAAVLVGLTLALLDQTVFADLVQAQQIWCRMVAH